MRYNAINWLHYLNNSFLRSFVEYWLPMINLEQYENPWETNKMVKGYASKTFLFKPEETILNKLKPILPRMKMLDVGVGTGRTTSYFAPLTREYVGIDFSANMIKFCKTKFKENKKWRFKVADARNLGAFRDKSFDFVLFSFNGLDCILNDKGRQQALQEIRRLINDEGYFCFSTNNLNYTWRCCQLRSLNINEIRETVLLRLYNWKLWRVLRKKNKNVTHMTVTAVDDNLMAPIYVSAPKTQLAVLRRLGYKKIQVFDVEGKRLGLSVVDKDDVDHFLYYLCQT